MASLAEIAQERTDLVAADVEHLQRLAGVWTLLADLCFADLVLYVPTEAGFLTLGHVRASTGQTLHPEDVVGAVAGAEIEPLLFRTIEQGEISRGDVTMQGVPEPVRVLAVPVNLDGRVIAVMTRERRPIHLREPSDLERAYLDLFDRFASMIAVGDYPFRSGDEDQYRAPRIGDGALIVDRAGVVAYGSPNAVSALHRLGFHAHLTNVALSELGVDPDLIASSFERKLPVTIEVQRGRQLTVLFRCIPLLTDGVADGALVVLRDISEVRRRDLMLLSKDATIREIHHRVKNNLQTVSSLLQLQIRRLESDEAKGAIRESARRIASIAIVHDRLAQAPDDEVAFDEVLRPLLHLVEVGLTSPERPVAFAVRGTIGRLPADTATPLAVVITELLQNAVDHAFPSSVDRSPTVTISLWADRKSLVVSVADNGIGLREGVTIDELGGLGMTIVRTFVEVDLGGEVIVGNCRDGPGMEVELRIPVVARTASALGDR